MKIESTVDYGQFKRLSGNRDINEGHIRALQRSVEKKNMLSANPIIVNEGLEIIDGQHRLAVAERLNVPIYYVIISGDIDDVRRLNTFQKHWSVSHYVHSYAKLGNKNYRKLLAFQEDTAIPLTISASLLMPEKNDEEIRGSLHHRTTMPSVIRAGLFKVTDEEGARAFAQKLEDYKAYTVENLTRSREFIDALHKLYFDLGVEHEVMLKNLEDSGKLLPRRPAVRDYLRDFEDVYNYRKSTGAVRFF